MTDQPRNTPQFYLTSPSRCPYLPGRVERKVFTHLVGDNAAETNDILSQGGFRRSQTIAYRPACDGCSACVSIRVVVDDFVKSRGFRRIWSANRDMIGEMKPAMASSDQYGLFREYLSARHAEGGMAGMSVLDYMMMVEETHVRTRMVEYRRRGPDSFMTRRGHGPLKAVALVDVLADGLSMVYSFYDPAEASRSLGTYMVLDHIERARAMGLPYLYLGYWVNGSRKMDYKQRFLPQERLTPDGWERVEE